MGLGYIGLPMAAVLAKHDFKVTGVDPDKTRTDCITRGENPLDEEGLGPLIRQAVGNGKLNISETPLPADIYVICVPTPISFYDNKVNCLPKPDMTYVEAAVKNVADVAPEGALVILESTSPVGSTEFMADIFSQAGRDAEAFHFAYCPERVLPGNIIQELEENDRIVGGLDDLATEQGCDFYRAFVSGTVWPATARLAELCKLVENSYRDVNIAFANEVSLICHELGLDVRELIRLANRHPRVKILDAGIGVGGHCIAVDPWFIAANFPEKTRLIQTARRVNLDKTEWIIRQIENDSEALAELLGRKPKLALFGLAYKANVADMRESPACRIAHALTKGGAEVVCVEPHVDEASGLELVTAGEACEIADMGVILVRHDHFVKMKSAFDCFSVTVDYCGLVSE